MQKRTRGDTGSNGNETKTNDDSAAKLRNAAGQEWDTERMDPISDRHVHTLQIDNLVLRRVGERKGAHRKMPRRATRV